MMNRLDKAITGRANYSSLKVDRSNKEDLQGNSEIRLSQRWIIVVEFGDGKLKRWDHF